MKYNLKKKFNFYSQKLIIEKADGESIWWVLTRVAANKRRVTRGRKKHYERSPSHPVSASLYCHQVIIP